LPKLTKKKSRFISSKRGILSINFLEEKWHIRRNNTQGAR
jgi:hypothetical protein